MLSVLIGHLKFGIARALPFTSMRFTGSVAVSWILAGALGAAEPSVPATDPFASYTTAADRQLSAMLAEPRQAAPVHLDPEPEPVPPTSLDLRPMDSISVDGSAETRAAGRNRALTSAVSRLRILRPALEQILSDEGVPKELVAVALVESGGVPFAISPRQARGLWQFMPETARHYGLAVGPDRDERVEIERSTRAAARYLRDLYDRFGNWPLALAAYNAGQGAVQKALRSSGTTTFWQLSANRKLPQETRNYVPAVLAAMRLLEPSTLQSGAPLKEGAPRWIYASSSPSN